MNTLRSAWLLIPRKLRVLINILLIISFVLLLYVLAGAPAFGKENEFRRVEKAHLVGPAEILGTLHLYNSAYDRVMLADDGDGAIMYAWDTDTDNKPVFYYRKKNNDTVVMAVPNTDDSLLNYTKVQMSIIAFADVPEAAFAELEFELKSGLNEETFEKRYVLRSEREIPGAFCFFLTANKEDEMTAEMAAIKIFELVSGYGGQTFADTTYPAQLRFYDDNNQLIETRDILIQSVTADASSHQ